VWAIKFVSALSLLPTELVSIPNADFNSSASVKMALSFINLEISIDFNLPANISLVIDFFEGLLLHDLMIKWHCLGVIRFGLITWLWLVLWLTTTMLDQRRPEEENCEKLCCKSPLFGRPADEDSVDPLGERLTTTLTLLSRILKRFKCYDF
jgi:hypothetical protein